MIDFDEHAPEPGVVAEPPATRWPVVIGTISIIYASAGLLCQAIGAAGSLLTEWLMSLWGMNVSVPPTVKYTPLVMAVPATILGVLLLVGAVGLLHRRRSALGKLRAWAVLRVVLIVVGAVVSIVTLQAQIEFQRRVTEAGNANARAAGRSDLEQAFDEDATWTRAVVATGVVTALVAIYPIFLGFYLSRQRIADEVAQWA